MEKKLNGFNDGMSPSSGIGGREPLFIPNSMIRKNNDVLELERDINGSIEFLVRIVNVSGQIENHTFDNLHDVNTFVIEINNEIYWMVQMIEMYKKFNFVYNEEIIHSPLHFSLENVTESDLIDNNNLSFLIIDKSLKNVKRTKR